MVSHVHKGVYTLQCLRFHQVVVQITAKSVKHFIWKGTLAFLPLFYTNLLGCQSSET